MAPIDFGWKCIDFQKVVLERSTNQSWEFFWVESWLENRVNTLFTQFRCDRRIDFAWRHTWWLPTVLVGEKHKLRFVFLPSLDDDAVAISEMMKSIEFPPPLDDMQLWLVLLWTGNLSISFTAHWWMYLLLMVWSHSSMFFHCSMMMQLHPLIQYSLGYIHIIYIHFNWIYWIYFIHILQMWVWCSMCIG